MSYLLTNKALNDIFSLAGDQTIPGFPFSNVLATTERTGDTVRFNETAEGHTVEIDLPGVKKADCKIELFQRGTDVKVYVKASRKLTYKGGTKEETFTREFALREAREENVNATLEDGVLTVKVPIETKNTRRKVLELQ